MKIRFSIPLFLMIAMVAPMTIASGTEGVEGRPATSREALIQRLKSQGQGAVAVASAEEQRPRWDLAQHSEFISFSGEATLLPKNAILHLPEKHKAAVASSATGKVISWLDFSAKYPAYITRVDVTVDQASGKTAIDPKVIEAAVKGDRIVVAVFNGNPISTFQPAPVTPAP